MMKYTARCRYTPPRHLHTSKCRVSIWLSVICCRSAVVAEFQLPYVNTFVRSVRLKLESSTKFNNCAKSTCLNVQLCEIRCLKVEIRTRPHVQLFITDIMSQMLSAVVALSQAVLSADLNFHHYWFGHGFRLLGRGFRITALNSVFRQVDLACSLDFVGFTDR